MRRKRYAGPRAAERAAMVDRCAELVDFTHECEPGGPAEVMWRERLRATVEW